VHDAKGAIRRREDADCKRVISDICLPGMNGVGASVRIRQFRHTFPVIVMTDQGTTETTIEATKRGSIDYQLAYKRAVPGRNRTGGRATAGWP
jgi:DNA-binding NtrC family response regulator